jgi:hypothetical protein
MGVWSNYCIICGGPFRNEFTNDDGQNVKMEDDSEWLINSFTITKEEKKLDSGLVDCGVSKCANGEYCVSRGLWKDIDDNKKAICCHQDCYSLLEKEINYKLKFNDVDGMLDYWTGALLERKLYGKMTEYSFGQEFEWMAVLDDGWLLESPLKNKKNKGRILKIWRIMANQFGKK